MDDRKVEGFSWDDDEHPTLAEMLGRANVSEIVGQPDVDKNGHIRGTVVGRVGDHWMPVILWGAQPKDPCDTIYGKPARVILWHGWRAMSAGMVKQQLRIHRRLNEICAQLQREDQSGDDSIERTIELLNQAEEEAWREEARGALSD